MLTDYILTQLLVFVHKDLHLIQLMFLELVVSSSGHPVSVQHEGTATLLTGSVDYAIVSSVGERKTLADSLGVGALAIKPLTDLKWNLGIKELTSGNSLDGMLANDQEAWSALQGFKHFKFTIIEEKRKDTGTKTLKDYEPQVTGEALALYVACYFLQQSRLIPKIWQTI